MSAYKITFAYKIVLDNGVWYVVESDISNPEDFIRHIYNCGDDIHVFKVRDKSLFSDMNFVAINIENICSIEWKGVSK